MPETIYVFARKNIKGLYDPWLELTGRTVRGVFDRIYSYYGHEHGGRLVKLLFDGEAVIYTADITFVRLEKQEDIDVLEEMFKSFRLI